MPNNYFAEKNSRTSSDMDEGSHLFQLNLTTIMRRNHFVSSFHPISLRPRKQNLFLPDQSGYEHNPSLTFIDRGKKRSVPAINLDFHVETPKSGYSLPIYANNNSTENENENNCHKTYLVNVPLIPNLDDTERVSCIKLRPRKRSCIKSIGQAIISEVENSKYQ